MKRFVCTVCGYIYEGQQAPAECPVCHQPGEKFREDSSEVKDTAISGLRKGDGRKIAQLRGKKQGEDVQSPSRFPELQSKDDLKDMVTMLRNRSDGRPIGIKIAAGSSPLFLREATTIPTVYALYRARKYLDSVHSDISLVITGGLRVSPDIAKALAMGADAVAVASGALIAAACQQYRICGSGNCPVGIATQNPQLRERLKVEQSAQRVANYLNVTREELKTFARITGHSCIHDLSVDDLVTFNREISDFTNIPHA